MIMMIISHDDDDDDDKISIDRDHILDLDTYDIYDVYQRPPSHPILYFEPSHSIEEKMDRWMAIEM
jgi:hypothetical protein